MDYLNHLAQYTGYEYEYISASWEECLAMLQSGEIDLVCSAGHTAERAQLYDFTRQNIITINAAMYTRADNTNLYYEDFAHIDGQTIGVMQGSVSKDILAEYAQHNGFTYTTADYVTEQDLAAALEKGEVDIIVTEQLPGNDAFKTIGVCGEEPLYIMLGKNSAFTQNFNYAMGAVNREEPSFTATLYTAYYGGEARQREVLFTREEAAFVAACPVLRVAVQSGLRPMAYTQDNGELAGINVDILRRIAQISGLRFELYELSGADGAYDYQYFRDQKISLISGIEVNEFNKGADGLLLSNAYFTSEKSLVARSGDLIDPAGTLKIAIVGGSGTLPYVIAEAFPNFQVIQYKTLEQCMDAVVHKDADVLLYNQYLLEENLNRPQYDTLRVVPSVFLPESICLSPVVYADGVKETNELLGNPLLLSVINKAIAAISDTEIEHIVLTHTIAQPQNLSWGDFLYKFRLPLLALAVLVGMILFNRQQNLRKITEKNVQLAQAVQLADRASSAKSQFLSHMSHEIRTPMNAIVGITSLAKTHLHDPEKIEEYLNKINASSMILLNIINDVLDVSAIENEKLKIAHNPFDFKALLGGIAGIYYAQCKQKGISFEMLVSGITEETLVGDQLRVNQILLNLISNACKFTEPGGEIKVTVTQTEKRGQQVFMRITVADTGCGMTEEMKKRIFQPFEQEDAATAQQHGGSGLGLSITKNLVNLMHGAISVESKKDVGTTFAVELPFEVAQVQMPQNNGRFHNVRALVVDDDKEASAYTSMVLQRIGVEFDTACSGEQALDIMEQQSAKGRGYDVCFIDWKLPGMNGLDITRKIRRQYSSDTVIIIVSAYDLSEVEDEAKAAGADMFVAKPLFQSTVFNVLMSLSGGQYTRATAAEDVYDFTGHRVLLAEDNAINREIAVELLQMVHMQVDTAENGKLAVEMFAASAPGTYDAVLMDIQMPVMDGYQAADAIRASSHPAAKTVPVFAMTANAFTEDVAAALSHGMNGHIAKPIDTEVLYSTLQKAILP